MVGNAGRAARQDHGFWRQAVDQRVIHALERMDFAIDAAFAQPPGNELRDLAAEIDDQTGLLEGSGGHAGLGLGLLAWIGLSIWRRPRPVTCMS